MCGRRVWGRPPRMRNTSTAGKVPETARNCYIHYIYIDVI